MFVPRDYQSECVDAIIADFESGIRSVFIEMATGLGKTEIFVMVAGRLQRRSLVICPMNELITQAARKFYRRTGSMPDIEQANNWASESEWSKNDVICASKQTLTRQRKDGSFRYERLTDMGLLVWDEAHHSITPPCKAISDHFAGQAFQLGVTATAKRHDKMSMGNMYDKCSYQFGIADAVPKGWLVPCITDCIKIKSMDLSDVSTSKGDFTNDELNKILEQESVMLEIADVTARESGSLKTVIFCASVAEARGVANILKDRYHLRADWICGDKRLCSDERRKDVLASFMDDPNGLQFVANVGVLTTGWDFPGLEHIVMARPTKSLPLYTQIFGRGTRPLEGVVDFIGSTPELRLAAIAASLKPHFKMTDLVDNSMRHKIVTSVDVLGGRYGLEVMDRAKKDILDSGNSINLNQALEDAKAALLREEQARQRRLDEQAAECERRRRENITAQTEYAKVRVDPFDSYSGTASVARNTSATMTIGKHKGETLCSMKTRSLEWYMEPDQQKWMWAKFPRLAKDISAELAARGVSKPKPVIKAPVDLQQRYFDHATDGAQHVQQVVF